ncbi:MAG: RusA family crossover junction endodeoxyribonuclease [Bifidobacterium crudilactis]|jgi:Holliday junction resolvase RusA-like endonuclease|nr:RusA family crossover junction endodeoxyribonuclease [Bifidobacterium crudilactis]MCI1889808.1 RusA family crossover junction endodeoxyribonuclease [Bifidobacterium crudilactis]
MIDGFMLIVPGDPQPKQRPKVYRGVGVTPKRTKDAQQAILRMFTTKYPDSPPISGEVAIRLEFWMASRHIKDWDNLEKLVTDALNKSAFLDDSQITRSVVDKYLPDQLMPGKHGMRKRKTGDPLTHNGDPYQPHTLIYIEERHHS